MTLLSEPIGSFRFGVFFFPADETRNAVDIRFRRVSGLSARVNTVPLEEGGQNLYTRKLPVRVEYENLVLERGLVVKSRLNVVFNDAMSAFKFSPSNVIVTLFNADVQPLVSWMFFQAYPVRWATSDLNAGEGELAIDTLELAYTRMQRMNV